MAPLWTLVVVSFLAAPAAAPTPVPTPAPTPAPTPRPQARPHGTRVALPPNVSLTVDDGDTVVIRWAPGDLETVRILGIDTPETAHPQHDLPFAQPFGEEARAFARGAFGVAAKVEILRAPIVDMFGRSLGYLFLDGRNYSALVLRAGLAVETISQYGDNGFPAEAAEVSAAAQAAGPPPFERPDRFRARMHELSDWMRQHAPPPAPAPDRP